jgi:hypothetical protein
MKKFFLFSALAMLALVGCQQQNQSGLDLKDVEKDSTKLATIKGQLIDFYAEAGQESVPVSFEGVRVYATVGAGEYVSAGKGNIIRDAYVDANNNFVVKVPVGSKEMQVTICSDNFSVKVGDKTVYYQQINSGAVKVNARDVIDVTSKVMPAKDAILNSTVGTCKIYGKVTYDAGVVTKADGTKEDKSHTYAAKAKVVASVKYFTGKVERKFMAETNANGEYSLEIPAEADGNVAAIDVEQYKANKTEWKNNKWTETEHYYALAAPVNVNADANTEKVQDLYLQEDGVIDSDKKSIEFTIKGELKKQVEEAQKDSKDNIEQYNKGAKAVEAGEYSFTLRLDYYGDPDDKSKVTSTILYEGLKVNGDKGAFSHKVKLYDGMNISKVKVSAYADKTYKVDEFTHYYLKFDADSKTFAKYTEQWSNEKVQGVYLGGEDNKLAADVQVTDQQLFFDLDLGTLTLKFQPENNAKLLGVQCTAEEGGTACTADKNMQGGGMYHKSNTVVVDAVTYSKGCNGCSWK